MERLELAMERTDCWSSCSLNRGFTLLNLFFSMVLLKMLDFFEYCDALDALLRWSIEILLDPGRTI